MERQRAFSGMRNGLSFKERVTHKKEYDEIMGRGARLPRAGFTIFGRKNEYGRSRLGIILSRKVKGAVKRNKSKRLVRELFRRNKAIMPACGADILVLIYSDLFQSDAGAAREAILDAFAEMAATLCREGRSLQSGGG